MGKKKSPNNVVRNSLTLISVFLMGVIDAYTFLEQDGSFASAQTGNLVTLSVKLYSGDFGATISHFAVFGGFAFGAFVGEALIQRFKWGDMRKTRLILVLQAVLLLFLALFQINIPGSMMLFFLGLLAGYELTVFRTFRGTKVNNGIMTGNTKNMMNNLYKALIEKDSAARKDFFHIVTTIIIFLLGVGIGAAIIQINALLSLWTALAIVLVSFLLTTLHKPKKQQENQNKERRNLA